jgi:hypothetical protein
MKKKDFGKKKQHVPAVNLLVKVAVTHNVATMARWVPDANLRRSPIAITT